MRSVRIASKIPLVIPSKSQLLMTRSASFLCLLCLLLFAGLPVLCAGQPNATPPKSQELSDGDGIPVLVKHLPNWENVRAQAVFANNADDLRKALGPRPILNLIEFIPGTEAVTAHYDSGTLLIVEYTSPQVSVETDTKLTQFLTGPGQNSQTVYRRIGNYNAMVLDAANADAAAALLDQVKYEKNIQWLGEDPFEYKRATRSFVVTTSDIFLSTVFVIVLGIGLSVVGGLVGGVIYFFMGEKRRAAMTQFTDAGGMTRLNLDGFTPDIVPGNLLKD
ncbi:MAG: hypothetical protein ACRD43_14825, partial [Pyrinomonadaceae bacterium]